MPDFSFFEPEVWSDEQAEVFDHNFADTDMGGDPVVEALFMPAYLDMEIDSPERMAARQALDDYIMDTYGVDFDDIMDWDEYRAMYGEL